MSVSYINRRDQTYHLHTGVTKTGKPRYWFSMKDDGPPVDSIPKGFEVCENPEAQVFLRKVVPQVVTTFEVTVVDDCLKRFAPGEHCIVDVQKKHIVIYHSEKVPRLLELLEYSFGPREVPASQRTYTKVMRFTLVDEKARTFQVSRWCFRGSVDDWIELFTSGSMGPLFDVAKKFCPHIGKDSFFELM